MESLHWMETPDEAGYLAQLPEFIKEPEEMEYVLSMRDPNWGEFLQDVDMSREEFIKLKLALVKMRAGDKALLEILGVL